VLCVSDGTPSPADTREAWASVISGGIDSEAGVVLPILSGSMGPRIVEGCSIRVVPLPRGGSCMGDIVVFRDGADLTAHRQLAGVCIFGKLYLFQKGDQNRRGSWIPRDRVVGMVAEAMDSDGRSLYSRELHSGEARLEARGQLLFIIFRPFYRLAQVIGKLRARRGSRSGS
jgi:hypothetical protein